MAHVDLAGCDLGRAAERAPAGSCRRPAISVTPGVSSLSLRADHRLARQVEVPGVGDDGAAHDLVDMLALQGRSSVDEAVQAPPSSCRDW